jgi:hypothetical protein
MKTPTKRIMAIVGLLALGLTAVRAQSDGALLDALVQKGVLSDQEAEDIRANEAKDYAQTPAGKLSISNHVTNLKLYGDARLRWEYIDETPQVAGAAPQTHDNIQERSRYRLRIGADYTFTDKFSAGVELETATAADSANQSGTGGFGNADLKAPINIGLVYLTYKPCDWLTVTGGKQRNPLYTTDLVWDPDINPEGASETMSWTLPIDFGSDAPASNDPKAIAAPPEPSTYSLTVGLTAAQFLYADNAETAVTPTDNHDVWMFVEQVPVQFNFDKDTFIKEVPGFETYMNGGNSANAGTTNGASVNFNGPEITDDLALFTAPGEVDFKLWEQPIKAYWDFSLNLNGKARTQDILLGNNQQGIAPTAAQAQNRGLGDNIAWLAGVQVGQNKKKGDWSLKGDFRQIGLAAVDPNLNDSDFGDSYLNMQGIKVQAVYNFTDFLTGAVTYFDTWNYKPNLLDGSGASSSPAGLPLAGAAPYSVGGAGPSGVTNLVGINTSQRVQVDLQWKF